MKINFWSHLLRSSYNKWRIDAYYTLKGKGYIQISSFWCWGIPSLLKVGVHDHNEYIRFTIDFRSVAIYLSNSDCSQVPLGADVSALISSVYRCCCCCFPRTRCFSNLTVLLAEDEKRGFDAASTTETAPSTFRCFQCWTPRRFTRSSNNV